MDRKTFIKKIVGAAVIAVPAYAALSCSTNESVPPQVGGGGGGDCLANGARASGISGNHGHSLVVSRADVNAGAEKTYTIDGTAGHSHSITITTADFDKLKNNEPIEVTSTVSDSHDHIIIVSCA